MTRRQLILGPTAAAGASALHALLPPWARSASPAATKGIETLSGKLFDLEIAETRFTVDGRPSRAITVNGQVPAPLLRWREGDDITLRVTNRLDEDSSIHWHGILLPFQMDGVPGVSFPGIKPGETFEYKFRVSQSGTYWYHSHSGLQEQVGHYGPIVIEPQGGDPVISDRQYLIVLSDWPSSSAERVFAKLKKQSGNFNFQKRTVGDFFRDASNGDLKMRGMWGQMRMSPTDIADVTGAEYTYLINGYSPAENWTALFEPGERVRLRIINASSMTLFDVRIPDLPMTVVQADGLNVKPVDIDEFQIGTAETFDVIVQPQNDAAYTIMCESNDRFGYAAATLATREGMRAPVPPLRERPTLTMKDMGMDHGDMAAGETADSHAGHDMDAAATPPAMDHAAMGHEMPETESMPGMDHAAMGHEIPATETMADMDHTAMATDAGMAMQAHNHPMGPGVTNVAMNPVNRLGERPLGLENEPHRVLVYTDLESLDANPDSRAPERQLELHLTSNMERYMWSFDGRKFSEVTGPVLFRHGERLRLTLVNDTMMPHPIHLHGMFFDVVTGEHNHKPRKHTIVVKPGEKMAVDITADALGDWAFHCHLLYHMAAGMMRVVSVRESLS